MSNFGTLIRSLRYIKRVGLRDFCFACNVDASNWSKVERGTLPPPQDRDLLENIAYVLELAENSKEHQQLFDYAAIDAGKIPPYVLEDAELVKRLPIFFRMASGKKPTEKDLEKIAKILRGAS